MTRSILLCGTVLIAGATFASAKEFPLEFKTLSAQEAMAFPGGWGINGTLQFAKPGELVKTPPAISKNPLYGQLSDQENRLWFRVDESQGNGKGYDRLIVDMNRNGDLTDDAAVTRVEHSRPAGPERMPEIALFGPIQAPKSRWIGEWQPAYFAQIYLYRPPSEAAASGMRDMFVGYARFKAGWYVETTVDLDGMRRKVGIVDGNCTLHLGDADQPTLYTNDGQQSWHFPGGDFFLQDVNGSGRFESSIADVESSPFGPILYLGATPYRAALTADGKSLALEPWTEPLAELALQPHGEYVHGIQLAWERTPDQWQLLQPGIDAGKVKVPPGNFRLYTCTLKTTNGAGDSLVLSGYKRSLKDTLRAGSNAPTALKCGSPLEIKVTSQRDNRTVLPVPRQSASVERPVQQLIEASVTGAGGETYAGFVLENPKEKREPPAPAFTITADGKQVGSGNMEFG